MHDRGTPQEQKLMRRSMPQLLVSTREDLVKIFFRAAHKPFHTATMPGYCSAVPQLDVRSENQKVRRGHPLPRRPVMIRKPRTPESSWRIHCSGQNAPLTEAWTIGVFDS